MRLVNAEMASRTLRARGPRTLPDALAERFFDLYERREQPELKIGDYIERELTAGSN
jgi:hypothetical protein